MGRRACRTVRKRFCFRALDFAARKHRDQKRKGAEASPCINHPIAVRQVLTDEGGITDPIVLAAAILEQIFDPACQAGRSSAHDRAEIP